MTVPVGFKEDSWLRELGFGAWELGAVVLGSQG